MEFDDKQKEKTWKLTVSLSATYFQLHADS